MSTKQTEALEVHTSKSVHGRNFHVQQEHDREGDREDLDPVVAGATCGDQFDQIELRNGMVTNRK